MKKSDIKKELEKMEKMEDAGEDIIKCNKGKRSKKLAKPNC